MDSWSFGGVLAVVLLMLAMVSIGVVLPLTLVLWERRRMRRQSRPAQQPVRLYHPDGVPVGLKPGDPVPPQNASAIFYYVQRHGQKIADGVLPEPEGDDNATTE